MADAITGSTDVANVGQAAVAELVQRNLIAKSKLLGTIWNVSELAMPGDKSVALPKMSNFTVTKKTSETAVDAAQLTYTVDTITFDQQAVVQWLVEKRASLQSKVALAQMNFQRAVEAHAKDVDTTIHASLIAGVSAAAPDHIVAFAGAGFAKEDITNARYLLDAQEAEESDRFLAINPAEEKTILDDDNFIDASKYGSSRPVQNGEIGMIFGSSVIKSTVVTAGRPLYYSRYALAIAFQQDPMFESQSDLANLATRYSLDQLYGLSVLQSGKLIVRMGAAS